MRNYAPGDGYHPLGEFRWTRASGFETIPALPGHVESQATGVSADGTVVVGTSGTGFLDSRAFRWTRAGGTQDLGTLPGHNFSSAAGVSGDGSVVVGTSALSDYHAFRWTAAGGMQDLGANSQWSTASGISGDGSVVIGTTNDGFFRWTLASGMSIVGTSPGAATIYRDSIRRSGDDCGVNGDGGGSNGTSYQPTSVSTDGSVIVGMIVHNDSSYGGIFRWTAAGGIRSLGGYPEEYFATIPAVGFVSGDGSTVVMNAYSYETAIWDEAHGTRDLRDERVRPRPQRLDVTGFPDGHLGRRHDDRRHRLEFLGRPGSLDRHPARAERPNAAGGVCRWAAGPSAKGAGRSGAC